MWGWRQQVEQFNCHICHLNVSVQLKISPFIFECNLDTDDFLCPPALCASVLWPANPYLSWKELHKRWICSSAWRSFSFTEQTAASCHPHPLPGTLIQPEPIERLKSLKMRHDESGSRQPAGCGQLWRWEVVRTCSVEVFNQARATSSLPGTRCCCVWREGETDGEVGALTVQHLFILLIPALMCFHLSCVPKGKTHKDSLAGESLTPVYTFWFRGFKLVLCHHETDTLNLILVHSTVLDFILLMNWS